MLSSRKTLEPRSLHSSTSRAVLLSYSGTVHRSSSSLFSFHRDFSWGPKCKDTTSRTGKVCKGSSTQDLYGKIMTRKEIYRSAFWGNHHLRRYLPRYAPIHEWRCSSSWGKKPGAPPGSRNDPEANEEEDWYTRWEKQKLKQYDDFMKKVEQDPYTVLFGRSWLNLNGEIIEPKVARTSSPDSPKDTSVPKNERSQESGSSRSTLRDTKNPEYRDMDGRRSKSETMSVQERDQEYVIDPITNRKVLKTPASPVSTSAYSGPQVKDGERTLEPSSKKWNPDLSSPSDHRYIRVEHVQGLSSSDAPSDEHPPSKDTSPDKPHKRTEWLSNEGFRGVQEPQPDPHSTLRTRDAEPNTTATKIESALDRHLSSKSIKKTEKNGRPRLEYEPKENKTEDIDLLRPSDVRASAGLRGNLPKKTDADKQAQRKKLEASYESHSLDSATRLAGEATSDKPEQKRDDRSERGDAATEFRFGSWLKGTLSDAKLNDQGILESPSAVPVNKSVNARATDPEPSTQTSGSTPSFKNEAVPGALKTMAPEAQVEATDKASKLKAQIVPFKAKLDAMKADYDSLRQAWLNEIRRAKESAEKIEKLKAQELAKRANKIHEEEIKSQKVAMEAMEMRSSNRSTDSTKAAVAGDKGSDDAKSRAPRRLQSLLQGEGDMASNVHEFAGRDRWYKKKAPHAMDATDAEMDSKLQKVARDRALIREIREIYEDTYGIIDTKHRQPQGSSTPPMGSSGQHITSSSRTVAPDTQLSSRAARNTGCSQGADNSESSDALVLIQRLFGQLREAQSIIQDYQSQINQTLDPKYAEANTSRKRTSPNSKDISQVMDLQLDKELIAFQKSVMQILKTSLGLSNVKLGGTDSRGSVEVTAAATSGNPVAHLASTTASKPANLEDHETKESTLYCILAYDSASESIKSVETTTLGSFSKEESLLPLDALNRVNNPGKFLPYAVSLGSKGYKPVSGTTNILVFKKEITSQDLAEIKKTDARKEPNPSGDSLDHLPAIPDGFIGTRGGNHSSDTTTEADIDGCHKAKLQGVEAEQHQVKELQKQAVEKADREHQEEDGPSRIAKNGVMKEKQSMEEAQKQQFASSASPSPTLGNTVHRQETVFSGARQGRWTDNGAKSKRSKRARDRRRKTMKNMFIGGAFTAVCCYCVGVAAEMMHN